MRCRDAFHLRDAVREFSRFRTQEFAARRRLVKKIRDLNTGSDDGGGGLERAGGL